MTRPVNSYADARSRAKRILPPVLFDFIDGGSGSEVTLRANQSSFEHLGLRPRNGVDVGQPSLGTRVLGEELAFPVLTAPCGGVSMVHPHGQVGVSRAAVALGTTSVVSTLCGSDLDVVPSGSNSRPWFQLYKLGGRRGSEFLIDKAKAAGYRVLVVAVDTPVIGRKDRDLRHGGVKPGGFSLTKVDLPAIRQFAPKVIGRPRWLLRFAASGLPIGHPSLNNLLDADGAPVPVEESMAQWRSEPAVWADLEWMRSRWDGPVVVKGVITSDDARHAADAGADGVIVSNHGGRQLDGVPATIDALPEVVDAVPKTVDVLLDGGVRRGADVARAVALGARAVLVGRPYLFALAVNGQPGVEQLLGALRDDLTNALQLMGCPSVADLDDSYLAD